MIESDAGFSADGQHRYYLSRRWEADGRACVFIMLNPSTADAENDDPTIRRCINFAKREGCNELIVVNLFSYRATDPKEMKQSPAPEGGVANDEVIAGFVQQADLVVAAWGTHGKFRGRAGKVLWMLRETAIYALGITRDGSPQHPLYIKGDAPLVPYNDKAKT